MRTLRNCLNCGKEFQSYVESARCCSYKCASVIRGAQRRALRRTLTCPNCNTTFTRTASDDRIYCSKKCQQRHKNAHLRVILNCEECGKGFEKQKLRASKRKRNFCSRACSQKNSIKNPPYKANGFWYENGYRVLSVPGQKNGIKEHIAIMEKHIGRKLKPNECIHHVNEIKDDNRLENLRLMDKQEHIKLHRAQDLAAGKTLFGGYRPRKRNESKTAVNS